MANYNSAYTGTQIDAAITKLSGIADGANNYVHPTTSGNKHIPSGGSANKILTYSADGTAVWGDAPASGYTDTQILTPRHRRPLRPRCCGCAG